MDRLHETYRSFYHHGFPLGFVTGRMLNEASEQSLRGWSVVIVPHANRVTIEEFKALSRYQSQNGTLVMIGKDCLGKDEYGRPHAAQLVGLKPPIRADDLSDQAAMASVVAVLRDRNLLPSIRLHESNRVGKPGCVWRTSPWEDGYLLLVLNLGKSEAQLAMSGAAGACRDLLTNSPHPVNFLLPPFGLKLLHVRAAR